MADLEDPAATALLARLNHTEFLRELSRWSGSAGRIEEREGVLLYASGTDFPVTLNGAVRLDPSTAPDRVLALAESWFMELGRGYTLSVRSGAHGSDRELEETALDRGLVALGDSPVMICRNPPTPVPTPAGVELRWTVDAASIEDSIRVSDAAYQSLGMPAGIVVAASTAFDRMTAPHLRTVVAYEEDRPLAAATLLSSHGIAGVYYVGTLEDARGRGLADVVTRAVTHRAFELGVPFVCLQASTMGEGIYQRMGYEEVERYHGLVRFV